MADLSFLCEQLWHDVLISSWQCDNFVSLWESTQDDLNLSITINNILHLQLRIQKYHLCFIVHPVRKTIISSHLIQSFVVISWTENPETLNDLSKMSHGRCWYMTGSIISLHESNCLHYPPEAQISCTSSNV